MIKSKIKMTFTACFLAVLFVLFCFVPFFGYKKASAQGNVMDPDMTMLYYFSDNPDSSTYYNYLMTYAMIEDGILYYPPTDWTFRSMISSYYSSGNYQEVENAYVIFEMTGGFLDETYEEGDNTIWIIEILTEMFSTMKENGCKIMFICGTDEDRIEPFTEFLDYVDIHINTDIMYLFFANVFSNMIQKCSGDSMLQDSAFFLDSNITSHSEEESVTDGWFFTEWFTPYFLSAYRDNFTGTLCPQDMFGSLVYQIAGATYYDHLNHQTLTFDSLEFSNYVVPDMTCAIGMYNGEEEMQWLDDMLDLRDMSGEEFPIYVYNLSTDVIDEENVYSVGRINDYLHIMEEFVNGEDMSVYDNIPGRCIVTHRPLDYSPNGWLREPSENGYSCWKQFMSAEDAAFFANIEGSSLYIDWEM